MANYTINTNTNYTSLGAAGFDRLTVTEGARLTINSNTNQIERFVCNTLGEVYVENLSTSTPIFIKTGENGATANGQVRFEAGGKFIVRGDLIEIGISSGFQSQTFSLPTNSLSEKILSLPCVFIYISGGTKPIVYNRVDSLTDALGDSILGRVFTHDYASNTITFGDNTEGHIPLATSTINISNIFFVEDGTGTGYMDFDLNSSGTLDFENCYWSKEHAFNFSSASNVSVENCGFDQGREIFDVGSQEGLSFKNVGVLTNVAGSGGIRASALNNFTFDNVFIYSSVTTANYIGFYLTNGNGGVLNDCIVIAPNQPYSANRASYFTTSANLVYTNCYSANNACGWILNAGSSEIQIIDCGHNGQGKRNSTAVSGYMIVGTNSSNNTVLRFNSYPLLESDGAKSSNTYCFAASTGTNNWVVSDCDIYVGEVGQASRSNNPIFCNGTNHRFNDLRIHGDFSGDTINHSTASSGIQATNIIFMNPETNASDVEWVDNCFYDRVASPDTLELAPANSGIGIGSLHLLESNDMTNGRIYKPMGKPGETGLFNSSGITGNYFFNNGGNFYMDTPEDIAIFESNVHGGILSFRNATKSGQNNQFFDIKVALRMPGGAYTPFVDDSATALNSALANISGYDYNIGLQFKWQVRRTRAGLTDWLRHARIDTELEPTYKSPFLLNPRKIDINFNFEGVPPTDFEWRLYLDDPQPGVIGTTEIKGAENETSLAQNYEYDYTEDTNVILQVIADGFEEFLQPLLLSDSNQILSANIKIDNNI